jgi:DNA-binding MarR family transcriptional regulator
MVKPRKRRTELPPEHVAVCMKQFAPAFEPLSARAMYALRSATALANDRISDWLVDFGLTPRTVNVLLTLYCENAGRGVSVRDVGEFIHTAGARLTETIDRLERDGLLLRKINAADRRSIIVRLTASGKKLIERAYPVLGTNFQRAFQALSLTERELFITLLVKLSAGLATFDEPAVAAPVRRRTRAAAR